MLKVSQVSSAAALELFLKMLAVFNSPQCFTTRDNPS
jgi:hypothetical protein